MKQIIIITIMSFLGYLLCSLVYILNSDSIKSALYKCLFKPITASFAVFITAMFTDILLIFWASIAIFNLLFG